MARRLRGSSSYVGTRTWADKIRPRIIKRDRNTCQLCHTIYQTELLEVDHIMPRSRGGGDHESNLRTLCKACHKARRSGVLAPVPAVVRKTEPAKYMAHTCVSAAHSYPLLRGNTTVGWWDGPEGTCPPGCPRTK